MLETINKVKIFLNLLNELRIKKDPFRLMGFGHKVDKNYDPRVVVMKQTCNKVLKKTKRSHKLSNLLSIAIELENIALQD